MPDMNPPNDQGCDHANGDCSPHYTFAVLTLVFRCNDCKRFWGCLQDGPWVEIFPDHLGNLPQPLPELLKNG